MKTKRIETPDKLKCSECGEANSKNGRPFTPTTLRMHQRKAHPGFVEAVPEGTLRCEVCGATQDRKGRRFADQASVLRHKRAAHGAQTKPAPQRGGNGRVHLVARAVAKFCPQCGCNLEVVNAALTLAEGVVA